MIRVSLPTLGPFALLDGGAGRQWGPRPVDACGDYDPRTSWPRISPGLLASVWMLTYHFPASSCAICASVKVAEPLIGLARFPVKGTTIPAFDPGSAGP